MPLQVGLIDGRILHFSDSGSQLLIRSAAVLIYQIGPLAWGGFLPYMFMKEITGLSKRALIRCLIAMSLCAKDFLVKSCNTTHL